MLKLLTTFSYMEENVERGLLCMFAPLTTRCRWQRLKVWLLKVFGYER